MVTPPSQRGRGAPTPLGATRISLCAIPDHVRESALARSSLAGADQILFFVPDSIDRIEETIRSHELLEETLRELGRRLEDVPLVWVWSADAGATHRLSETELESIFNPQGSPSFVLEPGEGYAASVRLACSMLAGHMGLEAAPRWRGT